MSSEHVHIPSERPLSQKVRPLSRKVRPLLHAVRLHFCSVRPLLTAERAPMTEEHLLFCSINLHFMHNRGVSKYGSPACFFYLHIFLSQSRQATAGVKVPTIIDASLGTDHPNTRIVAGNLSFLLEKMGKTS